MRSNRICNNQEERLERPKSRLNPTWSRFVGCLATKLCLVRKQKRVGRQEEAELQAWICSRTQLSSSCRFFVQQRLGEAIQYAAFGHGQNAGLVSWSIQVVVSPVSLLLTGWRNDRKNVQEKPTSRTPTEHVGSVLRQQVICRAEVFHLSTDLS